MCHRKMPEIRPSLFEVKGGTKTQLVPPSMPRDRYKLVS